MTTTDPSIPVGHAMTFTSEAKLTIEAMANRIHAIEANFGRNSPEACDAVRSFAFALKTMIGLGGRISSGGFDLGELSLYGQNEFICFGVVWSPKYGHNADSPKDLIGTWGVHS